MHFARTHAHTNTHTHTHTRAHTHSHTHKHTHTNTHTQTHTHTHTHSHSRTHTLTHTHTLAHTHTQNIHTFYFPKISNQYTSTADDGSNKQCEVTVVQFEGVKLHSKLKLGLHHLTERPSQALQELSGDEAAAVRHQQTVFIHVWCQHGEERLMDAVL